MNKYIDAILNSIPMYRVVLYGLFFLQCVSVCLGLLGFLPYSAYVLVIHAGVIYLSAFLMHIFFSRIVRIPTNTESSTITALILYFLLWPLTDVKSILLTTAVAAFAIVSKYLLAQRKVHVFNPAAIAVFMTGVLGHGIVVWWAGSTILLPFVSVVGYVIVHKIRRRAMAAWFLFAAVISITFQSLWNSQSVWETIRMTFLSGPILFFATVMLTEPLTTPPTRRLQMQYGLLIGFLYGLQFKIGNVYSSPELALVIGNLYSFFVSRRQHVPLILKKIVTEAAGIKTFYFQPETSVHFIAGQYMEWTLPHKGVDTRGNRRYFTIASSPTELSIMLGVKIPTQRASSYKRALTQMQIGDTLMAGRAAGDFILPADASVPLVFVAGGIGITPFRSMIAYLLDRHEKRNIHLLYIVSTHEEFAYTTLFEKAEKELGMHVHYIVSTKEKQKNWQGLRGRITKHMIDELISEPQKRTWFISGPTRLVHSTTKVLQELSLSKHQINTDYFPGF